MATITPVAWKQQMNKKGEHAIYVRIEAGNRRLYFSLGLFVKPRHWNPGSCEVRKTHDHWSEMNGLIKKNVNIAEKAELQLRLEGQDVTPEAIKAALLPPKASNVDFIAYGNQYAEELRKRGQIPTSNRYFSVMRKLERFNKGSLYFIDVTHKFLRDYETYMVETLGNGKSTLSSNFRTIRTLINKAKKEGLIPKEVNPLDTISIKDTASEKRKLTFDEIESLRTYGLESGSPEWHARNYWMLSMYVGGMRFRDVADLRIENVQNGRLSYKMSKTGGFKNVDIPPVAAVILSHYVKKDDTLGRRVFPMLDKYDTSNPSKYDRAVQSQNAYINKLLKAIAKKAGIYSKLSFHMSRHSFANIALAEGWSVRKIQAALGHKDINVTERYLRELDVEFMGNEMGELFGNKND